MNWYRLAQSVNYNYHTMHRPGDTVWIYDGINLIVDEAESESSRMTHNKSFGPGSGRHFFKGRFNPQTKLVSVVAHPSFISTDADYQKKQLENELYEKFGPEINIKYF